MPDIFVSPKKSAEAADKQIKATPSPLKKAKFKEARKFHQKHRHFLSFLEHPQNVRFDTQEQKEQITLLLRRHPITNVPWILMAVVMAFVPVILPKIIELNFIPVQFQVISTLSWFLLTFAFAFNNFLQWFFQVDIVTDERVVDIDFPTILNRQVSATKIDQVQEVNAHTGGFIRSLFNFGNVLIQTAGALPEVNFNDVPDPGRVVEILNQGILEEEQERLEGRVR